MWGIEERWSRYGYMQAHQIDKFNNYRHSRSCFTSYNIRLRLQHPAIQQLDAHSSVCRHNRSVPSAFPKFTIIGLALVLVLGIRLVFYRNSYRSSTNSYSGPNGLQGWYVAQHCWDILRDRVLFSNWAIETWTRSPGSVQVARLMSEILGRRLYISLVRAHAALH